MTLMAAKKLRLKRQAKRDWSKAKAEKFLSALAETGGEAEEAWVNLQFGFRRGSRPRALVTTTPRPMPLLNQLMADAWTVTTHGKTSDNINLDERTIDVLTATYGGTRIGAQELDGKLLEDVEGALWTREVIERARTDAVPNPSTAFGGPLPEASSGRNSIVLSWAWIRRRGASENSDTCGFVVCGSRCGSLYVLEDATVRG